MQVALSAIAPFVVGVCATQVTMTSGERYGRDTLPFVLVGMVRGAVRFRFLAQSGRIPGIKTLLPFLAAIVAILLIWLWQRQAFTMPVPRSGLTYGYFLTPDGAKARFWRV